MNIKRIALDGLFAAMCAVLGAVSIDLGTVKFTLENFPILVGALLFGPVDGLLIGGVGTFIYQILKYSLDASTLLWVIPYMLSGLMAGAFCKSFRGSYKIWKIILVVVLNGILVTGANTVSLVLYYVYILKIPVQTLIMDLPLRLGISVIKSVVFGFVLPPVLKGLRKVSRQETKNY